MCKAAGIISRTPSKAEDLANSFQIDQVYDSVAALVRSTPDGIMVLVSANQIYEVALKLLPEGIPLLLKSHQDWFPKTQKPWWNW